MIKKIFSVIVAAALLVTTFPQYAFAANDELQSGTYTITANLYVPGQYNEVLAGVTAYLSSPEVPPTKPVSDNALLTVNDDGTKTVRFTQLNAVFMLDSLDTDSNSGVEVVDKVYNNEKKINGETVTRISELEVKLLNDSEHYTFTNCREYAYPLDAYKNMPLEMDVDFSSAVKTYTPSVDQYESGELQKDSNTPISSFVVQTTSDTMKGELNNASLSMQKKDVDSTVANALKDVFYNYDEIPSDNIAVYTLSLDTDTKQAVDFTGNTRAIVKTPYAISYDDDGYSGTYEEYFIFRITADGVKELKSTKQTNDWGIPTENYSTVEMLSLGDYAIVKTTAVNQAHRFINIGYDTGDGLSYNIELSAEANGLGYDDTSAFNLYGAAGIKSEDSAMGKVYSFATLSPVGDDHAPTAYIAKQSCKITMNIPESDTGKNAYLIADNGTSVDAIPLEKSDNVITVYKYTSDSNERNKYNFYMRALAEHYLGSDNKFATGVKGKDAYILITDKDVVGMPVPAKMDEYGAMQPTSGTLTYNSKAKKVAFSYDNDKVEFDSDNVLTATDVQDNKITFRPKNENTVWPDGTTGEKTVYWSIKPKAATFTYKGETIKVGEKPTLSFTVSGVTSTDKKKTEYTTTLTAPENLTVGKYTLTPTFPESKNYTWTIAKNEPLIVLPAEANDGDQLVEIPTAITGLTYNGKEQTGVADPDENAGYTITDNKKTEAGTYKAVATLKEGYWWMDGTNEPKTIEWTIAEKKQPAVSDKDKTVTANLYMDGANNTILPGVTVYLNNPNNPIKGTGTPTTPQSDNATLKTEDGKMYLTLKIANPVFTLQKIDGCSNASVNSTETASDLLYQSGVSGKRSSRISEITFLLDDKSGTYTFGDCEEFPTIINPKNNWKNPLILKVKFSGGDDSSLDSKTDVDTGKITGGITTPEVKTDITVKVKDDTATVSKINTDDLSSKNSITLDVTDGNKGVTGVNLPVSALEKIVDAKVPGTMLTLSDTSAKFDLAALTEVTKAASGKTVDLRILTGTDAEKKLSATEKSAMSDVKNASAVSVALSSDDKAITSLGSGKLTVSVPFKWDGKGAVRAYQVDANGKLVSVPVTCKNNVAELTLTGTGNFILGTVDTKSFDDVADDAFYKTAVDWAVENGVTSGISDTLFAPAKTCTRAQVVTFLWRAAGSPEPTKTENPFTDVKRDAYYYKAVLWALEKGITSGTSATAFAPEAVVSRAQVVTFQWRMADSAKATGTNNFTDVPADSYYKDAVQWAAEKGITSGTSATTFAPNAGCTRGQIVTFLYRQLGK